MKLLIAWAKKKLGIQSPSTVPFGYCYEYDYLKTKQEQKEGDQYK